MSAGTVIAAPDRDALSARVEDRSVCIRNLRIPKQGCSIRLIRRRAPGGTWEAGQWPGCNRFTIIILCVEIRLS